LIHHIRELQAFSLLLFAVTGSCIIYCNQLLRNKSQNCTCDNSYNKVQFVHLISCECLYLEKTWE